MNQGPFISCGLACPRSTYHEPSLPKEGPAELEGGAGNGSAGLGTGDDNDDSLRRHVVRFLVVHHDGERGKVVVCAGQEERQYENLSALLRVFIIRHCTD